MASKYGRFAVIILLSTASTLSGCAGQVYLHSPSLQASAAKAAEALPSEATALKPFDDQLANLATFADSEDLAAAKFWTTFRGEHFTQIVAVSSRDEQNRVVRRQIEQRLDELLGDGVRILPGDRTVPAADLVDYTDLADARRRAYRRAEETELAVLRRADPKATLVPHDLTCQAVIAEVPASAENAMSVSRDPKVQNLGVLAGLCRKIAAKTADIGQIDTALGAYAGTIGAELSEAARAEAQIADKLSERAQALNKAIDQAEKWSKTESNSARLADLRASIEGVLDGASYVTKAVGWEKASERIDDMLLAKVCDATSVSAADKTAAGCDAVKDDSTTGRVQAVWGLARALAALGDVNAADRRGAGWLLAARAIVAAERANAALEAQKAKALAVAHRRQANLMVAEARYLFDARQSAMAARGGCRSSGLRASDPHCMLAAYLDAWNYGRIPAGVAAYTPIQIERAFAVRRGRAVAKKQRLLASAGLSTLKDYGAGGLTAAMIAQMLFDATLLGVTLGN